MIGNRLEYTLKMLENDLKKSRYPDVSFKFASVSTNQEPHLEPAIKYCQNNLIPYKYC